MSLYNVLARNVMAPTLDLLRGTHTMSCLRDLGQSQWWPRERIEELQSKRLRRLIEHAYVHVPYYRALMQERGVTPSDIRSASDLSALPVLTRQQVQRVGERMVADNWSSDRLHLTKTSGSTGTPLQFYGTREDQLDHGFARSIRAMEWAGLHLGDRMALIGRPRLNGGRRYRFLQNAARHMQRSLSVHVDTLSDEALPGVVRLLAAHRLDGIWSYPNAIALIAGFIRDTNAPVPTVRSIVTGGAELLSHERSIVRDVFGTEPYSKYSSYEALDIACECGAHEGLHISAEDVVLEVVDDTGAALPPGTEGRIVVTNLHNYGMPFIRYDLGDSGSLMTGTCSCKRTLPRLGSLVGRKNRFLVTRSGARVFPGTLFLDQLAGLGMRQYQIVQETVDEVVMRLIPPPDASSIAERAALERRVAEMFDSRFGPEFSLRVEFVDHIKPSTAGKHVLMLSMLPDA